MPRATIVTQLGLLAIESAGETLVSIRWADGQDEMIDAPAAPVLREAASQLQAYFEGRLTRFDLPLASAASPRGQALRDAIAAIPYGETASYGQVARMNGSGPRAVGQACARNPFPVVIPCHRVLAAQGALGHYSGGQGIETKLALLRLESPDFHPSR